MAAAVELSTEQEARAQRLHKEAFVFDACLPGSSLFTDDKTEVELLVQSGLSGLLFTAAEPANSFLKVIDNLDQLKRIIERHSDHLALCTTVAQLERCKQEGKTGMVIHFQESKPIEDSLAFLRTFYDLGLRVFQLTYNNQDWIGTGCCERYDTGLTYFGLKVVEECNRLRILIDLSHCSYATCWDTIKATKAPVALTHANAYALCPAHGRNKPDDIMKAVVDTGGMVGATFFPSVVKRDPVTQRVPISGVDDVVDHLEHMVNLVGVDNVGFGSDLTNYYARTLKVPETSSIRWYRPIRPDVYGVGPTDVYDPYPTGLDSHGTLLNLTRGLVKRGYGDEDVKKIMGGNWMRFLKTVWGE